jgi:hypothetical protein
MVLLATAGAACITVAAVLLLTAWAYATATGITDPHSPNIDPIFEVHDKLVWVVALGTAGSIALLLALVRRPLRALLESWPVIAMTVAGTAGIAFSAAWVDDQFGLGPVNLVLAVVLVPLLVLALGPGARRLVRLLWPVVAGVGIGIYLPALWQTPQGLYDALHGARSIDELLGPVAGKLPLSDYVPQYGGMLGLPLVPFRTLVADHVEWAIMSYISVLSVVTVGAACVAAALMLPRGRRALAPLLVVPVLLMKPSAPDTLTPAGVERLFQSIPERSLLPVLLAVVLLLAVLRPESRARWIWAGAVGSLAALNNFESGIPATVAAVLAIVALRAGWRALGYFALGWAGVAAAYVGLLVLRGGTFRPDYWVGFGLEFASGFAAYPMPPYGNYVFVLFILVASVASAFPVLWRGSSSLAVAAVGGLYFGTWGLVMFPYYVGRSSTMGQLQFFLIPGSIAAVWLLVGAAAAVQGRRPSTRLAYGAMLCCLPAAVFATTVIKAPSPETSFTRLTGGFAPGSVIRSTAWKRLPVVTQEQARTIRDLSAVERQPVGLFFTSGNIAALKTGLPNASILAVPEELLPKRPWSLDPNDTGNAAFRRMQCQSLEASSLNTVIAEDVVAAGLDTCTGFTRGQASQGVVVFTRATG